MEKKFITFELDTKSSEDLERGVIAGYGAVFSNVDQIGDVILPNAFDQTLASGRKVKMYFQHDDREPVGVWTSIKADQRGLRVEGKVADTTRGKDVKELLSLKAVEGLSVGYRVIDSEYDEKGNRLLKAIDLFEVSIVDNPCNTAALIDSIKSMTKRDLEAHLRDVGGFSQSEAKALLAGGYAALTKNQRDVDEMEEKAKADLDALIAIRDALLRK